MPGQPLELGYPGVRSLHQPRVQVRLGSAPVRAAVEQPQVLGAIQVLASCSSEVSPASIPGEQPRQERSEWCS